MQLTLLKAQYNMVYNAIALLMSYGNNIYYDTMQSRLVFHNAITLSFCQNTIPLLMA